MVKKFEIDENLIAMAAFTKIVKKFYTELGANRSPEVIEKFKQAMINPEHFCRLDFDADDVQRKYANLKITIEFDPADISAGIVESDILEAYNEIDKIDTQSVAVNAGRFLDMLDDKAHRHYKIGDFAPERDDTYFTNVLDEKLKHFNKLYNCDETDTGEINHAESINIEQITQNIKNEIYSEIKNEIPKAMENCLFSMK